MKSTLLLLILGPLMGFAEANFDLPLDSQKRPPAPIPKVCRKFSDPTCFGRSIGSMCQVNFPPGRMGSCRMTDFPEQNGDVSCQCN